MVTGGGGPGGQGGSAWGGGNGLGGGRSGWVGPRRGGPPKLWPRRGGAPKGRRPKGGSPNSGTPKVGPQRVGSRRVAFGTQKNGAPHCGAPKGGGAKISRFFPFPATIFFLSFFSLFGVLPWNFGGVRSAGALKCSRLEFSVCRVKPRRPRSRRAQCQLQPKTLNPEP